ncbi:hypothetical protein GF357_02030 [Candidatus Dojkabacteria bacterium]|nr:hypothetical protein [Candidatus Dojkabacteria bacterium]
MAKSSLSREKALKVIENSRQKAVGYLVFTLFVVSLLLIGAIRPTVLTVIDLLTEIEEKEATVEKLDNKINALKELRTEYNGGIRDSIADLSMVFPTRGDFSLFLANIEKIADSQGFGLVNISFEKYTEPSEGEINPVSPDVLVPWTVIINVRGDSANLIKLLKSIESMPMYPEIQNVSFSNKVDDQGMTTFTVVIKVYKIEDPEFYEMK